LIFIVLPFLFLHVTSACIPQMCDVLSWLGPISPSSVDQHDVTSHCFLKQPKQIEIPVVQFLILK